MHERDRSIERLLQTSRQSQQAPPDGMPPCLDAETLAAWVDGGLSGPALEMAQSHVADCARCQTLVGAFGRVDSAAKAAAPERAGRGWFPWLVPIAGAAAAVVLWVVVPRDDAVRVTPPANVATEAAADAKAQEPPPAARDERPPQSAFVGGETNNLSGSNQPRARTEALESRRDAAQSAAVPERPASPPTLAETVTVPMEAVPPPSALEKSAATARAVAPTANTVGAVEILSPDPSVRWRIAGTVVQRSLNGGARWDDVSTGVAAEFTAGAAPSALVCWLVGRRGVVLLSPDGRTWQRVAFREMTDLSAVRAKDARAASVTTADGRTFSTTDGGATWVSGPLQEF